MVIGWALLAGLALVLGCSEDAGTGNGAGAGDGGSASGDQGGEKSDLVGKINIDGSSTVYPMTTLAADGFLKSFPKVEVTVGLSGTGGGFKVFSTGETDISDASRPIKLDEFQSCRDNNVEFLELPVAYDGLTFAVNRENTFCKQLTVEQLQAIFHEGGSATKWSDLDPSWPANPIEIFAPGTDSGTFDYVKEVLCPKKEELRRNMTTSEDDNQLVNSVAGKKDAIGFFGASYYFLNKDKLNAVAIVNPGTSQAVVPSSESIESGEYAPFSRPLFIYVNAKAATRPEVKAFVEYYLKNAARVAEEKKYVALPADFYSKVTEIFNSRTTGTHFLNAEGEHRKGPLSELFVEANLMKNVQ